MNLNDDERSLFENIYLEKRLSIGEKYQAELKKIDYLNDVNKHPLYLKIIKQYAREEIDARVLAYIEIFKRVGKYPDESDFEFFVGELKKIADNFKNLFVRRYTGAFSPIPKDIVDRILEVLSAELSQIVGLAIVPLRRFMSESKVPVKQNSLIETRIQSIPWESEIHISSIESFSKIIPEMKTPAPTLDVLKNISEKQIKEAFADIIFEGNIPKDWGGEQSDLFSANVIFSGKPVSTAFLFKGPSRFKPLTMSSLGKNGDQIVRLFNEPARLLILQHCHQVKNSVRATMRAFASQVNNLRYFCIIDGYDTVRLLRAYEKCGLNPS